MIVPPWPNGGSANVFEACVAAHAAAGRDVHVLIAPDQPSICARPEDRTDVEGRMSFPGAFATEVLLPARHWRYWLNRRRHRLRRAAGNAIDFWASNVAARRLPPVLRETLRARRPIEMIHVHHCWNMKLAAQLAARTRRADGGRPRLICETHDVQSQNMDVIEGSRWINRRFDRASLVEAETRMCRMADLLVHINPVDEQVFRRRLPDVRHSHLGPTIAPSTEARLRALRDGVLSDKLVYVATSNYWNIATVVWLIEEVLPQAPRLADHLRIYGDVQEGLRRGRPDLYATHGSLFAGRVERVADAYADACGILVPALAGSGSSIKLLEGLCTGRPLLGTTAVTRGVPADLLARMPLAVHDEARSFAQAAVGIISARNSFVSRGGEVFDRHYSNAVYRERLGAMLATLVS
ncbi:glycosyltransferase [Aquibium sp. ELW1220]|uniref:glycosyltransferase n=1 Tax=Aquibium sp. ELW1220 TaxID=2976766 RepID=UPI0025B16D49|nr:glycosyltransferase [Aquibium sp. ELW1220]MDN2578553.1 glycosyltransferase family 4 protein [Aquibium sp. ELW1220]